MEQFSEMLQKLMEAKKVSLSDVSRATGIVKSKLSRFGSGAEPKSGDLLALAQYFGVSMEYLLLGNQFRAEQALKAEEESVDYVTRRRAQLIEVSKKLEELNESIDRILES